MFSPKFCLKLLFGFKNAVLLFLFMLVEAKNFLLVKITFAFQIRYNGRFEEEKILYGPEVHYRFLYLLMTKN
jgi:hypothetical protein